jgi:hypothetical protein
VAQIDQTGRQDVKHVEIKDLRQRIVTGEPQAFSERVIVNVLERLRETITSADAQKVTHKWNISFDNVLPVEAIQKSKMPKVQNFLRYRLGRSLQAGPGLRNRPGGQGMGM